jgi:hypothetical protein
MGQQHGRKPHRRPDFDAIVMGWGSDNFDDLTARIELVALFVGSEGALTEAEDRTVKMMIDRQITLGIERGDFEDCGIRRVSRPVQARDGW